MCAIEEQLKDFPSFWMPGAEDICGAYCILDCKRGFPYLILKEWRRCLRNEERRGTEDQASSEMLKVGAREGAGGREQEEQGAGRAGVPIPVVEGMEALSEE